MSCQCLAPAASHLLTQINYSLWMKFLHYAVVQVICPDPSLRVGFGFIEGSGNQTINFGNKLAQWTNPNKEYHDLDPSCSWAAWDILECMLSDCNWVNQAQLTQP